MNINGPEIEKAHIVSVKTLLLWIINADNLIEKNKWFLFGIKHLNCLNLSPDWHKRYDKSKISINPETGKIWHVQKMDYLENNKINSDELKDKKEYLKLNWNNFKENKRNL